MRRRSAVAALLGLCVAAAGPADSQPATLIPIELGALAQSGASEAHAINALGQVSGAAEVAPGVWHPFLWRDGTMSDLGADEPWDGERGRIDASMLGRHLADGTDAIFYLTGPPGMVQGLRSMLAAVGVDEDDIRTEEFTGY